jgi:hypothetical protein
MQDIKKEEIVAATKHHEERRFNPFILVIVLVLALLIILMVVPYEAVRLDPEPKNIPSLQAVMPTDIDSLRNISGPLSTEARANYARMMFSDHQAIKNMASKIATDSCPANDICYAKAMFTFVKSNMQYVGDPPSGYLENPFETLYQGGADCDGLAILLANLESAVGIPTRFVFVPGHVFVQVRIEDATRKYKEKDGWISIDPTCTECEFGELPFGSKDQVRDFLYV